MTTTAQDEHLYRYLYASTARSSNGYSTVSLATSGGGEPNPWLASGFVVNSQESARALVAVGGVAAERFWTPPNMLASILAAADPVVTTEASAIRFESFSLCGGVYARFDLDSDHFDGKIAHHGTTNIDMGRELKRALSQIGGRDPLKLSIGMESVEATTMNGQVVERKIPLPERWVRGFANVSLALSCMQPVHEISGAGFRKFVQSTRSPTSRSQLWAVRSGATLRLSARPRGAAVRANGIERLSALRMVLPHVTSLVAYGSTGDNTAGTDSTAWVAHLQGGRVTIALSPEAARGFSGEGAWLLDQADMDGAFAEHVQQASVGRVGFDLDQRAWFRRDLPFDRQHLERGGKRLQQARRLVESKSVSLLAEGRAAVISGQAEYSVDVAAQSCTCPWWGKYRGSRGPCKHVLAAILVTQNHTRT
ncbi:MAG: SWIM zinc finger family protein [Acidimicrobiales bacterium]